MPCNKNTHFKIWQMILLPILQFCFRHTSQGISVFTTWFLIQYVPVLIEFKPTPISLKLIFSKWPKCRWNLPALKALDMLAYNVAFSIIFMVILNKCNWKDYKFCSFLKMLFDHIWPVTSKGTVKVCKSKLRNVAPF